MPEQVVWRIKRVTWAIPVPRLAALQAGARNGRPSASLRFPSLERKAGAGRRHSPTSRHLSLWCCSGAAHQAYAMEFRRYKRELDTHSLSEGLRRIEVRMRRLRARRQAGSLTYDTLVQYRADLRTLGVLFLNTMSVQAADGDDGCPLHRSSTRRRRLRRARARAVFRSPCRRRARRDLRHHWHCSFPSRDVGCCAPLVGQPFGNALKAAKPTPDGIRLRLNSAAASSRSHRLAVGAVGGRGSRGCCPARRPNLLERMARRHRGRCPQTRSRRACAC
jgi:hypothetical protein